MAAWKSRVNPIKIELWGHFLMSSCITGHAGSSSQTVEDFGSLTGDAGCLSQTVEDFGPKVVYCSV